MNYKISRIKAIQKILKQDKKEYKLYSKRLSKLLIKAMFGNVRG